MKRRLGVILLVLAMMCGIASCGQSSDDITASNETLTGNITPTQVSSPIKELPKVGVSFWSYLCGNTHIDDVPDSIIVGIDQGGYLREAHYDSPKDIEYAISLLADVNISEETNEDYTDNYNYIIVYWSDDTYTSASLNLTNLEISEANTQHYYKLANFDEFWIHSKSIAVDSK